MTASKQKRTVLISGASAGIGRACALMLAQRGNTVLAMGRRMDALQSLADEAPAGSIEILAGDLNDASYLDRVDAHFARSEVFINNAGVLRYAPLMDLSDDDIEWMFQTNVLAAVRLTRRVARHMVARQQGHIVFMSSIAAREVYRLASGYCATKHALSAFARSFRLELQSYGVKVTEVAPGMVDTNIREGSDHPAVIAAMQARRFSPLTSEEVAGAVVYALEATPNLCPDLIELRPLGSV